MSLQLARIAGVILVLAGLAALSNAALRSMELPLLPTRNAGVRQMPQTIPEGVVDSAIAQAIALAPFRQRRTPARPYDPSTNGTAAPPEVSAPPKPPVMLAGIVWGTTPLAALEGVPGREGSVILGVGDTAGGLGVRRITSRTVILAGYDTVWNLRIRERP